MNKTIMVSVNVVWVEDGAAVHTPDTLLAKVSLDMERTLRAAFDSFLSHRAATVKVMVISS